MENLLVVMSNEDIQAIKIKYAGHPDVVAMIDGYLAKREAEAKEKAIKEAFTSGIESLFNNPKKPLPRPVDVHNIYARYVEVDIPNGEPEEVKLSQKDLSTGLLTIVTEMRQPTTKVWKWVVEVNKGFTVPKSAGNQDTTSTASKRAITVKRIVGNTLELVGNFQNGKAACDHLHLDVGVNSAPRVLRDNGYLVESYNGSDFIDVK